MRYLKTIERIIRDRLMQIHVLVGKEDITLINKLNKFYVELIFKFATASGNYDPNKKKIKIYNLDKSPQDLFITILHQISHHYQFISNKRIDQRHDKDFYLTLRMLLQATIDLNILTKADIQKYIEKYEIPFYKKFQELTGSINDLKDSRDKGQSNMYFIIISNVRSEEVKNLLKQFGHYDEKEKWQSGYIYDSDLLSYCKYGYIDNISKDLSYLTSIKDYFAKQHERITVVKDNRLEWKLFCRIVICDLIFEKDDTIFLKNMEFVYINSKNIRRRKWSKIVPINEAVDLLSILLSKYPNAMIKIERNNI